MQCRIAAIPRCLMPMPALPPFLTAAWRRPLLLSWPIPADALLPLLPAGLALDCWQGRAWISLVGLCFADTRIFGIPAWPRRYAEVNLRFYVRRTVADDAAAGYDAPGYGAPDDNRPAPGVVFIRQIVPHRITAFAARRLYGEPFVHRPVQCQTDPAGAVAYRWRGAGAAAATGRRWHTFQARPSAVADAPPAVAAPGSLDEFLTARYWGYHGKPGGTTRAYQLTRSPWLLQPAAARIDADLTSEYGAVLAAAMSRPPASALLASDCRARIRLPRRL